MTKIIICGSRSFTDWYKFYLAIDPILKDTDWDNLEIVSGGALGPDMFAMEYAHMNNIKLNVVRPQWKEFGRGAGFKRNADMMRYCLDTPDRRVIAFWDNKSRGTKHMIDIAKRNGFDTTIIPIE